MSLKSIAPVPFDWRNIPVYPAANCVRLMREDEKQALKADMDARGLLDPITLGRINGMLFLIDGRNRLSTCEDLGIEPRFETLEFTDDDAVRAFVASRSARRDLTKGERAAAIALLYPEPERGRGKKDDARKETENVSFSRIKQARQVGRYSIKLLESVRDGTVKLDDALETVKIETKKLETADERLGRLNTSAPDLAELVHEDRMTLDDASAALDARERKAAAEKDRRKREREQATRLIQGALTFFNPRGNDPREFAERILSDIDLEAWPVGTNDSSIEVWAEAAKTLAEMVNVRKEHLK